MTSSTTTFRNWNGSQACRPSKVHYPRTQKEIEALVKQAYTDETRIRVVGRGVHTFGFISMCDPNDLILNFQHYNQIIDVDKEQKTVTAQAGIALEDLLPHIEDDKVRLALSNMGEIAEQCLGGVTATGTHGSGGGGPTGRPDSFSDQVVQYKIMECTQEATVHILDKSSPDFCALQTHLGTLAIVLEVTLQLVDWYHLEWKARDIGKFHELTVDEIQERYEQVYSLSYTYFPTTDEMVELARDKTSITKESGVAADVKDEFVSTLRQGASRCLGCVPVLIGPYAKVQKRALLSLSGSDTWRKILSQGDLWGGTNVTLLTDVEYAVPIEQTMKALASIRQILQSNGYAKKILCVVGVRFVRASPALMACHYSSSSTDVFAFLDVQFRTKKPDRRIIQNIQSKFFEMGGRAHWGKYNTTTRGMIDSNELWPSRNLEEFLKVKKKFDPKNVLGNKYLDQALGLSFSPKKSQRRQRKNQNDSSQEPIEQGIEIGTGSF
jgi:FAD/FMN-containing dehydrogenase